MIGDITRFIESRSPFFLYDKRALLENAAKVRALWTRLSRAPFQMFYSMKANPNPYLLRALAPAVDGFDVSSCEEFAGLLALGVPAGRVTVSGPAKTDRFWRLLKENPPQVIHLDSTEDWTAAAGISWPESVHFSMRVADPRLPSKKLGIAPGDFGALPAGGLLLSGIHFYMGRESFALPELANILDLISTTRASHAGLFTRDFAAFIGAGLPPIDSVQIPAEMSAPARDFPVHLETGRAIVAGCGVYAVEVLAVKPDERHRPIIIVNGGIQHISGAVMALGTKGLSAQVYRSGKLHAGVSRDFAVYGSLCLAHDVLLPSARLPSDIRRGDWLLLAPAGAYGLSASAHQFIGQDLPKEFLVNTDPSGGVTEISPRLQPLVRDY
jgi:diaminopimelate decarboxylase